ncbi:hypothetical protein GCM10027055_19870 [Janibacter alkaliphilus]|uniref:DUF4328 domain-containing protein n=1 Tax=Janibacter alkaliphilus TaxID=1069963 RepID=A0A852X467_9MICO|nr:DUF4328 domain-containing protein [Janibacter alkaliphilus]NYG35563.1 hypothetical protein [Janibacter alkaliphilus]
MDPPAPPPQPTLAPTGPSPTARPLPPWWPRLAAGLQLLLAVVAALSAITVIACLVLWLGAQRIESGASRDALLPRLGEIVTVLGILLTTLAAVTSVAAFALWLYLASASDRVDWYARYWPGWALLAWVLPWVNLVLPALVVLDLDRRSRRPGAAGARRPVQWWWATWVALWPAAGVMAASWGAVDPWATPLTWAETVRPAALATAALYVLYAACALLARHIVVRLTAAVLSGAGAGAGAGSAPGPRPGAGDGMRPTDREATSIEEP